MSRSVDKQLIGRSKKRNEVSFLQVATNGITSSFSVELMKIQSLGDKLILLGLSGFTPTPALAAAHGT